MSLSLVTFVRIKICFKLKPDTVACANGRLDIKERLVYKIELRVKEGTESLSEDCDTHTKTSYTKTNQDCVETMVACIVRSKN